MRLERTFEVTAPADRVWAALNDLEQVVPCLPGAAITGRDDDGTHRGRLAVELGPAAVELHGTIRIESAGREARTATFVARGSDPGGQGDATATIATTLAGPEGGGTRVHAVIDLTLAGRLASSGHDELEGIADRLVGGFAERLQARLGAAPATAERAPAAATMTADEAAASAGAADQVEAAASAGAADAVEPAAPGVTGAPGVTAAPGAPVADGPGQGSHPTRTLTAGAFFPVSGKNAPRGALSTT